MNIPKLLDSCSGYLALQLRLFAAKELPQENGHFDQHFTTKEEANALQAAFPLLLPKWQAKPDL